MDAQSEIPNTGSSRNSKKGRIFGRPLESNGSPSQEAYEDGKDLASTPVSLSSTRRDSNEEPALPPKTHRRAKRSLDNARASDRLSLFGSAFGGTLGKSRKPPPRYSGGCVFIEIMLWFVLIGKNRTDLRTKKMTGHPERETRRNQRLRSPGCTTSETEKHLFQSILLENSVRDKWPWTRRKVPRTLLGN